MSEPIPPFSQRFDLATVPASGTEIRLNPPAPIRAAIAAWAGVSTLDRLEAEISLTRFGPDTYSYDAHFEADVEQACVVTLEPVRTHIASNIQRRFRIRAVPRQRKTVAVEAVAEDDEVELLEGSVIDLAAPVLEEFLLAIDPYPRAPGAHFAEPEAPAAEHPFAVLGKLKYPQSR